MTMAEQGETLIPADQPEDQRVDAAVASALTDADTPPDEEEAIPFGMSWAFNFETGRFVREGSGATRTYGVDTLEQWCLMAMNSTRFAHDVFSEAFGVESLDDIIGTVMASELAAEFEARLRDALLVHDRVVAIEDFAVDYQPAEDALYVQAFTVVTDEEDRVSVSGTVLSVGGDVI
jgi:Protein of unknown function (DUF2634)